MLIFIENFVVDCMFENNGIKIRENFSKTIKFYKKNWGRQNLNLILLKTTIYFRRMHAIHLSGNFLHTLKLIFVQFSYELVN
jgi:hypothetical protein